MITFYNSLSRTKEEFKPIDDTNVRVYSCGPTVYGPQHIGNLRSAVLWDFLKRILEYNGLHVTHVTNITDFGHLASDADDGEDKMLRGLRSEGLPLTLEGMQALADKYTTIYMDDRKLLNIKEASSYPRATNYIQEDIAFIRGLEEKGFTYATGDGIYFDTAKDPNYGKLRGGRSIDIDPEHARITENTEKRQQEDFALWKFNNEIGWDSPWGQGFPGWHIECSVMSKELLGETFDIHTGGKEHVAIHHSNEIAQTESLTGKPMAQVWLHNNWLTMKNSKLAKSQGNVVYLEDIADKGFSPLALRYLFLGAHYRTEQDFTWETLEASQNALTRLSRRIHELPEGRTINTQYKEKFTTVINDDMGIPQALALTWELLKDTSLEDSEKRATILDFDRVLGLGLDIPPAPETDIPHDVQNLINKRERAREKHNWEEADSLRDRIEALGFTVEDSESGPRVHKK